MIPSIARLLAAAAFLLFAAFPARADDGAETLQNFKKYFQTYKDAASRVEAVLTLEGLDDALGVQVVNTLVPKLKEVEPEVARAITRVLAGFKTRPPLDALLAALKDEKNEAVKIALLRVLADGKYTNVRDAIQPNLAEKSWEIRRRALQALLVETDPAIEPLVLPLCSDPEPAVRCEALEGLAARKSQSVVAPAIAGLADGVWQIRASSILALTKVRAKEAVEPLVLRLQSEEGRLTVEIGEALANLTGREYGGDAAKWKQWWDENKAGFTLPTEQAIAYLREKKEARTGPGRSKFEKTGVAEFTGIETKSRSIIFVIDTSGSMEALIVEKERFEGGGYSDYSRMRIVKEELKRTLEHLEPYVNFNIIAFATEVNPWKKKLVPATITNRSAAKDWVERLEAIGGSSKEDLAMAGLMGSANLDKGKTNTFGAIMAALEVPLDNKGLRLPQTGPVDKNYQTDVDTVFFLSDGRPTVGAYVEPDDILREVLAANELRKIVIHTIAIGEFQKDFMRRMAEQNGGVFVDLGR